MTRNQRAEEMRKANEERAIKNVAVPLIVVIAALVIAIGIFVASARRQQYQPSWQWNQSAQTWEWR